MTVLCGRYSQQYGTPDDDGDDEYEDEDDIETDDNVDADDDDDVVDVNTPLYVDRHVDGQDSPVLLDFHSGLLFTLA